MLLNFLLLFVTSCLSTCAAVQCKINAQRGQVFEYELIKHNVLLQGERQCGDKDVCRVLSVLICGTIAA